MNYQIPKSKSHVYKTASTPAKTLQAVELFGLMTFKT